MTVSSPRFVRCLKWVHAVHVFPTPRPLTCASYVVNSVADNTVSPLAILREKEPEQCCEVCVFRICAVAGCYVSVLRVNIRSLSERCLDFHVSSVWDWEIFIVCLLFLPTPMPKGCSVVVLSKADLPKFDTVLQRREPMSTLPVFSSRAQCSAPSVGSELCFECV